VSSSINRRQLKYQARYYFDEKNLATFAAVKDVDYLTLVVNRVSSQAGRSETSLRRKERAVAFLSALCSHS